MILCYTIIINNYINNYYLNIKYVKKKNKKKEKSNPLNIKTNHIIQYYQNLQPDHHIFSFFFL